MYSTKDAHLRDGQLKFDFDEEDKLPDINPDLEHDMPLKPEYGTVPSCLLGIPLEEIDEGTKARDETFVVISKRLKEYYIARFSASESIFCLSPWNICRRVAIFICTNQYFNFFILFAILANCFCLASSELTDNNYLEMTFFSIFTAELIIRVIARGLVTSSYSYLRFPWNWLRSDCGYSCVCSICFGRLPTVFGGSSSAPSQSLRVFRVLRVLKTVSISPGLKTLVNAMLKAFRMLFEVILVTTASLFIFAVYGIEAYRGTLRQKCVIDPATLPMPPGIDGGIFYAQAIRNSDNWFKKDDSKDFFVCGNNTGAGVHSLRACFPRDLHSFRETAAITRVRSLAPL
ncbi:hypothetical protein C0Q70_20235 [Pomacea canaliculata]|uniref:Ion transport domain-containing protein n=1 Tax=Pomacea canaliculata TaxID=400727 RepID=A0A2T7NEZ8_POMCA|nr:hypothetical protein C0Q70_20235 [Pomacea canaliculata]